MVVSPVRCARWQSVIRTGPKSSCKHDGVNDAAAWVIAGAALLVAVWALVLLLRDRTFSNGLFYAYAVLEVLLLAQLVSGFIALARTSRSVDGTTFGAYLVTAALVPPAAVLWGVSDKSRWGTGVGVIGGLVVAVLMARLVQIWAAPVA